MRHSDLAMGGDLDVRVVRPQKAPWTWRLQNAARWSYLKGWLAWHLIRPLAAWWGIATMMGKLELRVRRGDGSWLDYGVVGYRVITDAGVAYMVDDFDNGAGSADISLFNFHGIGTGSVAEAVGDTALGAESTTALNPDSTRATGTRSQPTANQYRSIGTLTADAQILAREHGLFTTSGTGTGTLWDRTVYALITLESADSLQATYTVTCSSGG